MRPEDEMAHNQYRPSAVDGKMKLQREQFRSEVEKQISFIRLHLTLIEGEAQEEEWAQAISYHKGMLPHLEALRKELSSHA